MGKCHIITFKYVCYTELSARQAYKALSPTHTQNGGQIMLLQCHPLVALETARMLATRAYPSAAQNNAPLGLMQRSRCVCWHKFHVLLTPITT